MRTTPEEAVGACRQHRRELPCCVPSRSCASAHDTCMYGKLLSGALHASTQRCAALPPPSNAIAHLAQSALMPNRGSRPVGGYAPLPARGVHTQFALESVWRPSPRQFVWWGRSVPTGCSEESGGNRREAFSERGACLIVFTAGGTNRREPSVCPNRRTVSAKLTIHAYAKRIAITIRGARRRERARVNMPLHATAGHRETGRSSSVYCIDHACTRHIVSM